MLQLTDYESKSLEKFEIAIIEGRISNEALVKFFELCGQYLNVCSITEYAKQNKLSYNGAKKRAQTRSLNGIKYLVNNL